MVKVCVATITRQRPIMLEALLASFAKLRIPEGAELAFLVVDNDAQGSAEPVVAAFGQTVAGEVRYAVEPQQGIPFARNRALEEANAIGAGYLAFVDDDETVDADWLIEIMAALRGRGLELVGGPVRCSDWVGSEPPSLWQRLVFDGIRARYVTKENSAGKRSRQGSEADIVIVTNNWLIDLAWQRRTGLRFDESLKVTGGSDALFYKEARSRGVRSGWSETAIVRERIPLSRATFAYQFNRARNQSIASFHRNNPTVTAGAAFGTVSSCVLKALGCVGCVIILPAAGGTALIQFARQSGWAVGRLQALTGANSSLYSMVDGE